MIIINNKDYEEAVKTIDEDVNLDYKTKEYVKSLFTVKKRINKITWKIAQERMNSIKGRENHVIIDWNGSDKEVVIAADCKHIIRFRKGSKAFSEYNGYGGWDGSCYKCNCNELQEKIHDKEYGEEIRKLKDLVLPVNVDGDICLSNEYFSKDKECEMFTTLVKLIEEYEGKKYTVTIK